MIEDDDTQSAADAQGLPTVDPQLVDPILWAVIGRARQLHRIRPEFDLATLVGQAAAEFASRPGVRRRWWWLEREDVHLILAEGARQLVSVEARSDSGSEKPRNRPKSRRRA